MISTKRILLPLSMLLALGHLPLLFDFGKPIIAYSVVWIGLSVLYLLYYFIIQKEELNHEIISKLLTAAIVIRILFLFSQPVGSDDVYRYMWDGKTQDAGINPYLYKPADEKLNFLHSDILPSKMNFKEMKTIYFPLSQWLFYVGYKLSGEAVWAYKLLLLLSELLTLFLLYKILAKLNIAKKYLLLYALAPLPIIQFALDAHLDGFGLPLLLAFIYFYLADKKIISAIFLGLSFSIKPVGVLILPILFLREKKITNKLLMVTVPFIAFGIQFLPYIFSANPLEAFLIYTRNWFYNGLVFNLLNSFIHNNQTTRFWCSVVLLVSLVPVYFSKKILLDKIYFAVMLLMIFSPVVHPWYISWVLILVVLTRKWSGAYFAAAASLTSLTVLNYQLNGVWKDYLAVQIVEYVPVIALLIFEFLKSEKEAELQKI
ncbi:MAG: hypothetical protein Q8L04_16650, partial [Ignavibacteria bacterium]|nr:hypothetical protein [Ignavibacteria bacterium]